MHKGDLLEPVHFIKIANHGSLNGTDPDVLEEVMPATPEDDRARRAVVSTHDDDWVSVPDPHTVELYSDRCTLLDTREAERGAPVEIVFDGSLGT